MCRLLGLHLKNKSGNLDIYYEENDTIDIYTIQELLGEGRYGIVYLAVDEDKNKYVVKQLKKEMIKKSENKLFYEELCLKKLQHPYFPKFILRFKDKDREGYILEYIEGEVFEDILRKERYQFNREEIYEVCGQLLDMVELLHSYNIVHSDIRPPNIIRKDNKELSLIDFGLARIMDNDHYTKKLDYWCIGDFLIHLYYTTYQKVSRIDKPWFKELDLMPEEKVFLKRLMGIEKSYENIHEIRQQLNKIKNSN
ncbi:protein kinase family protein [Clostridium sp. KNHs205]|uniref:protein kinase family protein n=1 Tax=Clostridium sp. KNHs205 TaxID=1449050 RepID=UPI00068ED35A|nr:protein kinase family protein [Clostridium sp. KNHs205]